MQQLSILFNYKGNRPCAKISFLLQKRKKEVLIIRFLSPFPLSLILTGCFIPCYVNSCCLMYTGFFFISLRNGVCTLRSSVSNPFYHGITQNPVRSPFPLIRVVYRLCDFGQVVKLCIKPGYTLLSVQCTKPSCFIINVDVDNPLCIFHWYLFFACLNLYELRYPF